MTTTAKYYPPRGLLHACIALDGKVICIFKKPPTSEQGHAMAKALTPIELPAERETKHWDGEHDAFGAGFNCCLALWKESLQ